MAQLPQVETDTLKQLGHELASDSFLVTLSSGELPRMYDNLYYADWAFN